MANKKAAAVERREALAQSILGTTPQKREQLAQSILGKDPSKLAQEMLGAGRRSSTPRAPGPAGSLASRAGITKRSNSLPRTNNAPPRNPRQPPSHLSRPPVAAAADDNYRPRNQSRPVTISSSDPASDAKSNGYVAREETNGAPELNIRGAAGPYVVRAQNFAPGTTAADIESVMQNVGGNMVYCKLVSAAPTVIAEMSFIERTGAEKVIEMFNNKKADGRLLYVYSVNNDVPAAPANGRDRRDLPPAEEEPLRTVIDTVGDDTMMEVDEHAGARAAEDRQREERRRRGDDERGPRGFPRDSRLARGDDFPRGPARAEPEYQDGRYGFGGSDDRRYGGRGERGRYRGEGRMYSDGMRRGGGGQSYRP